MDKELTYSYPTSPNAKRLGYYAEGCWTLRWGNGEDLDQIKHWATSERVEAFKAYLACPGEPTWCSFTPNNHPGLAETEGLKS